MLLTLHFMKAGKYLILIGIISIFSSCILDSDYAEDLSCGCMYRDEGEHTKDILCGPPIEKHIYSEIIGYDYNRNFIVAAQRPRYEEHKQMIAFNLRDNFKKYPTNSGGEIEQSEQVADSILKNDPFYVSIFRNDINYWIVSKEAQKIYGPFNEVEYNNTRKKLNVPDRLKIDYDL